jgi:hypothetical protein
MRIVRIVPVGLTLLALGACGGGAAPKPYENPAWGFGVTFHGDPKVTEAPASAGNPKSFSAEAKAGGRDYVVSVTDATVSGKTPEQLLDAAPQATADGEGGTLKTPTYVATGKIMGREFVVTRPNLPLERDRIFVANGRFYQLVTQSPYGAKDTETQKFFDSFHIAGQ